METLWEAVKVPSPSPNFPTSLCEENGVLHQDGKNATPSSPHPPSSPPYTPSRHRQTPSEAKLSARCSLQGGARMVRAGNLLRRLPRLRLREHLLPASLGAFPPASLPPRPESWKRNRAQEPTNLLGNLGPAAEPRWKMKGHKVSSRFQLSGSRVPGRSGLRVPLRIPISPPAPGLSAFLLGSGLLTHKGSPGLHAEPQSDGQQRLALHPAARVGRGAQNRGAGPVSPGAARREGVEVDRAPQRRSWRGAGRGALARASAAGPSAGAGSGGCAGWDHAALSAARAVRSGRGNPTTGCLRSGLAGQSAEGEPVAETLERGAGRGDAGRDRGQGSPHPVPAPPLSPVPRLRPGLPTPLTSPDLPLGREPRLARVSLQPPTPTPTSQTQQPSFWQKEYVAADRF